MTDNKGRETRGVEKQTVSERRQSVSLLSAVQPGDSHANSVCHTPAFRRAAFRQRVMFSFAHPVSSIKKRPSGIKCIISPCTHRKRCMYCRTRLLQN